MQELLALNNRVVRFQGMVQDMYDEEFFVGVILKSPDCMRFSSFRCGTIFS